MFQIRYLEEQDREFWYTLDRHLPETEELSEFLCVIDGEQWQVKLF